MYDHTTSCDDVKRLCTLYSMIWLTIGMLLATISLTLSLLLFGLPVGFVFLLLAIIITKHTQIRIGSIEQQAQITINALRLYSPYISLDDMHFNLFSLNTVDLITLYDDYNYKHNYFTNAHTINGELAFVEITPDDEGYVIGIGYTGLTTLTYRYIQYDENGEWVDVYR